MNRSVKLNEDSNYSGRGNSWRQLTEIVLTDLAQKSADLEMENKNLKRERELATGQYNLLKKTNENRKAQIYDENMKMVMKNKKKKSLSVVPNQSLSGSNRKSFPHGLNGSIENFCFENGSSTILPMRENAEHHPGAFAYVLRLPMPLLYPFNTPNTTQHLVHQTAEPNESLVRELGSSCLMNYKLGPSNFADQEAGSISSVVDGGSVVATSASPKMQKSVDETQEFENLN